MKNFAIVVLMVVVVAVFVSATLYVLKPSKSTTPACDAFMRYCDAPGWVPGEPYSKADLMRETRKRGGWEHKDGYKEGVRVSACIQYYDAAQGAAAKSKFGSWDAMPEDLQNSMCKELTQKVQSAVYKHTR